MVSRRRNGFGAPSRPWRTMLSGIALAGFSVGVYFYLAYLENESLRTGARFRVNWLLATLYNTGGKPLAAGFFALVGAIIFGAGLVSLLRRASEIGTNMPVPQQELTSMLMPALDFTADDLAANRQGMLTERQRDRLGGLRKQGGVATLVMGLILVLALAGIGAYVLFF